MLWRQHADVHVLDALARDPLRGGQVLLVTPFAFFVGATARPALASERVQCNATRQVVLKLKTP